MATCIGPILDLKLKMRFQALRFCLLLLPLVVSGQSWSSTEIPDKEASHPRILFYGSDEARLHQLIIADEVFRKIHSTIVSESEDLLQEDVAEYKVTGRRLLSVARESRRKIFYLSYAWRMTRDERFLQRAEKELLALAKFPDWNPSHFLDAAELTMACAIGYDWLYPALSVSSREIIAQAIINKGLVPSLAPENSKWLKFSNNWNQVCNAGMVFGALAVKDLIPDLAMNILRRSIKSVSLGMEVYEPDGGYPEGYGYWAYGTTFNVLMISALEKEVGPGVVPMNEGFLKTGYYLRHMAGPSGQNFNYSDNHPVMPLNPAMFWFADRNNDPGLLYNELKILRESRHLHRVRELPAAMLWAIGLDLGQITPPQELVWIGKGKNQVATLRSGWTDESLFIGLKAGSPAHPHGHMDAGSFVFDALGERWVNDLPPQNYHSLEKEGLQIWRTHQNADRWRVFRLSNLSHNVITIDNKPLIADAEAQIDLISDHREFLSCASDLSGMYGQQVNSLRRGVAIIGNNKAVVQDEVTLRNDGHLNWKMLTAAEIQIIGPTAAKLSLNGKEIMVVFDLPPGVTVRSWSADPPATYDEPNPGYSFIGFDAKLAGGKEYTFRVSLEAGTNEKEGAIVPIEQWPY